MRKKPGPPAYKPTATQRRRVMRGIASGLTLEELATDLGMAYGTMRRVFANEIKTARVRLILDNLDRLHEAADSGNVSAMKTLLHMMQRWRPDLEDEEDDDAWEDTVPNLSRNPEIQNGKIA
ncbi:MAG TPA: hypothetical protein VI137_15025 [Pseudolabrys sp.]